MDVSYELIYSFAIFAHKYHNYHYKINDYPHIIQINKNIN